MKSRNGMGKMYVALLSGGLVVAPLAAMAGGPVGATLQTEGNAGLAFAGNSAPAKLSVVVTKSNGRPATGFAPSGNDVLPAGWGLVSGFNVPPGGCAVTPIAFTNVGAGIYTVEVVPGCLWVAGEHHYMVSLSKNGRRGGGGGGGEANQGNLRASTLGTLEVPSAP
ncbi:MAG: hypothetical protein ACREXJ_13475 [Gammaproteobacteria bacterium]